MEPLEIYRRLYRFSRKCISFCGLDVTSVNFKVDWRTIGTCLAILLYFVTTFYTIWRNAHENSTVVPKAFCMAGSVIHGVATVFTFLNYKHNIRNLNQILENTYQIFQNKGTLYIQSVERTAERFAFTFKFYTISWFLAIIIMYSVPMFIFGITGQKILIMQSELPHIDPKTNTGYFLTLAFHAILLFLGATGIYVGDMLVIIFVFHSILFTDILRIMFQDFKNALKEDTDSNQAKKLLIECLRFHQDYCSYLQDVKDTTFYLVFTAITTGAISTFLTIYISLVGAWPAGYSYAFACLLIIFVYCILGSILEVNNDSIIDYIYDADWYNLKVADQKMIHIMLVKAQRPVSFTVGHIAPLNVSTGLQVVKAIYSGTMLLLEFL